MQMVTPLINKEVSLLSRLRHPHIVQLLAMKGKSLYVCTEYTNGQDLESIIFDDTCTFPSLLDAQKHHICKQLLQAVAYMHNQQVIHQDIKLANILISAGSLEQSSVTSVLQN